MLMTRRVPKTGALYWMCQVAGWGGYVTYVLGAYLYFSSRHELGVIVSMVVFCTVVPIAMTHAARYWMHRHQWMQLSGLRRRTQMVVAAFGMAVTVSVAVGVVNGLPQGRIFDFPASGFWWMLFAYDMAFGGWMAFYSTVQVHRQRQEFQRVARDAQLRALRAQLNPHFLFNSLNSVRSLITENPQRAASMVTGLSEILRYSLTSDRKDTVSLAEELGVIDEYVGVERVRYEDRLRVEQSVDPRALDTQVPPMILQTLVENAVKHGIAMLPRGGVVRLDAQVRDGRLEVVVTNTGKFKPSVDSGGFGLQNAAERLRLLYGNRASLTIKEESHSEADYTVAQLVLPVEAGR
jgi:two-component system, LytTR family, sensor kinase